MSDPELELKVTMLNINLGYNRELMEKCTSLYQYSFLIDRIRNYAKQMPIDEAVDHAVTECIKKDILRDFLSSQRSEVVAMSILEWNEEIEMEKLRRSERKAAMAAARAEVLAKGLEEGRAKGLAEGREKGLAEGKIQGESLFALLTARLLEDSRIEDLKKAIADPEERNLLYKQYGLLHSEDPST